MVNINQLPKGPRRQISQAVGMVSFRPEARLPLERLPGLSGELEGGRGRGQRGGQDLAL